MTDAVPGNTYDLPSPRSPPSTGHRPRRVPGEDDINFLIFFDQPTPRDIGSPGPIRAIR